MCGIAGIVNLLSPAPGDLAALRRMADALIHRGPDEDGYLEGPGLGVVCRRLSIVGLQDGRQPIGNEDRSIQVVFNGELFDYPETRGRLAGRGHVLRTQGDTEIVPHLYEDLGEGMLEQLRGQFALALWDQREQKIRLPCVAFAIFPSNWPRRPARDGV